MRLRISPRRLAALTLGLSLVAGVGVLGQEPAAPFALVSARITLAGTSNIHDYTASTTKVRLTELRVAEGVAGPNLWDAVLQPGALEAFAIAIPAASLSSPKEGLDKNMHKALKVKEHADITFRLLRLEPSDVAPGVRRATGLLTIAGVEREIAFDITTALRDGAFAVTGEVPLVMTDFGINPPKAMLGMLRTNPKVTVRFDVVLGAPLT